VSACLLIPWFYILLWHALPFLWKYWTAAWQYGLDEAVRNANFKVVRYVDDYMTFPILSAELHVGRISTRSLLFTGLACLAGFLASFVRQGVWLPFAYMLRMLCAFQLFVCVYFWLWPHHFIYDAAGHLQSIFLLQIAEIAVMPLLMGLIFYPLDMSLIKKAMATLLILAYMCAVVPWLMLLHAIVLTYGSLLFMPFAYFILGGPLLVALYVALYSYCMSWRGTLSA
jgi:hypothetical protein